MGFFFSKLLLLMFVVSGAPEETDDYSFIDDNELLEELSSREQDYLRISEQVENVNSNLLEQTKKIASLSSTLLSIDERLIKRTSMLYYLSRRGKALKYLTSSDSALMFLKRIETLKLLVTSLMEEKRAVNVALTEATQELLSSQELIKNITITLSQLDIQIASLKQEKLKRALQ